MSCITKPSILVTSTGRTGTRFLARLFDRKIPGCDGFHEPDCVTRPWLPNFAAGLRHFDLRRMTVDKLTATGNMRGLSIQRNIGRLDRESAARRIWELRADFVGGLSGDSYAEANHQLVGLIDVLPDVFSAVRIIYIVRDGRDWVTSFLRKSGGFYSRIDWLSLFGNGRLSPRLCPDDPWAEAWHGLSKFDKNCWLWARKNRYALHCVECTPQARMWRFEDLFSSEAKYDHLRDLFDYATQLPGDVHLEYESLEGALERPDNVSRPGSVASWAQWPLERVARFHRICGELMDVLGYGREPQWMEKIEAAREAGLLEASPSHTEQGR